MPTKQAKFQNEKTEDEVTPQNISESRIIRHKNLQFLLFQKVVLHFTGNGACF